MPAGELDRCDRRLWYIPHHGVNQPQKNRLQIDFDCGISFQGMSLNGQLLQGQVLTSLLARVITRFCKERVVLITDTESMFHQVRVPREDSDLLRFLRWPDGENMVKI